MKTIIWPEFDHLAAPCPGKTVTNANAAPRARPYAPQPPLLLADLMVTQTMAWRLEPPARAAFLLSGLQLTVTRFIYSAMARAWAWYSGLGIMPVAEAMRFDMA
jgi:hypothetical protein